MTIHPTAIVSSEAEMADDVRVGPYAVIEDYVQVGAGTEIGAYTLLKRGTSLGRHNRIFEHVVLGGEPQDLKFRGETSKLVIGDHNVIREFATLHRACGEGQATTVGSKNFFMVGVHVAHNCQVGDENVFANGVALAGHITVEDHVFLSNNVGAHQFVRFGRFAMVGGKSKIVQDVLPFFITDGNPPRVRGINSVGLRRAEFSRESRLALKEAYRILFRASLPLPHALEKLSLIEDHQVTHLLRFIQQSTRGFTRAKGSSEGSATHSFEAEKESLTAPKANPFCR